MHEESEQQGEGLVLSPAGPGQYRVATGSTTGEQALMRGPATKSLARGRPASLLLVALLNSLIGILLLCVEAGLLSFLLPYLYSPARQATGSSITALIFGVVAAMLLPFLLLLALTVRAVWQQRKRGLVLASICAVLQLLSGGGTIYGIMMSPASGGLLTPAGSLALLVLLTGSVMAFLLPYRTFRRYFR